ncbi:MAG: hypothetical protein JWM24_1156 [Solirubrobacterales bacterium]|nr:hypothetical protein [Solirubrobacterales bacterium]
MWSGRVGAVDSPPDSNAQPERLNQEGFTRFAERAGEEAPVVMLNLLAFEPAGGRERYEEYGEAVAPLLERAGGRIVFIGNPSSVLLGEGSWDLVLLVEYPTRQAFLDMVGSPEYLAIAHLRTEALSRGELHPLDPAST